MLEINTQRRQPRRRDSRNDSRVWCRMQYTAVWDAGAGNRQKWSSLHCGQRRGAGDGVGAFSSPASLEDVGDTIIPCVFPLTSHGRWAGTHIAGCDTHCEHHVAYPFSAKI